MQYECGIKISPAVWPLGGNNEIHTQTYMGTYTIRAHETFSFRLLGDNSVDYETKIYS